jgi:Xaa-Pro aminopeptidase
MDGIIIPPGPNFFYFTGMETESMERFAALLVTDRRVCVLCPRLMEEQVINESWIEDIVSWKDGENPFRYLDDLFKSKSSIGLDGGIPYSHFTEMQIALHRDFRLSDSMVSELRIVKGREELDAIQEATRLSEKSLSDVLGYIQEGITEKQFARTLENKFLENGLDSPAFPTIVAFGKNGAMPHHNADNTELKKEDSVVIDYGGKYHGYSSDNTRTFFNGNPIDQMVEIYECVREANESARSAISATTSYAQMDSVARRVISSKGYGDKFIHRLGHGLGISVHEPPYLIPENTAKVLTHSVFTIEPGIYIDNMGGVRIEDTNYFDGKECIPFNTMSREIRIL